MIITITTIADSNGFQWSRLQLILIATTIHSKSGTLSFDNIYHKIRYTFKIIPPNQYFHNPTDNLMDVYIPILPYSFLRPFTLYCSPNGELLATGTSNNSIAIFKTSNFSKMIEINKAHSFFVTGITFSSDSKTVVSISADYSCLFTPVPTRSTGNPYYLYYQ